MNIDKSKLNIGIWVEDKDGNKIDWNDEQLQFPENACTYHTCFPLEVKETIYRIVSREDINNCSHPKKFRKKDYGLLPPLHGQICECCGKYKIANKYIPLLFKRWKGSGNHLRKLVSFNCNIGSGNDETIYQMITNGEYTLSEALAVLSECCERCHNAINYRYTKGKEGYSEQSDEYKNCGTRCKFCS